MNDKNYNSGIKLKIGENTIEIFGSEEFVNNKFDELKEKIENMDIKNMNIESIGEFKNNNSLDENIFYKNKNGNMEIIADIDIDNK
jgi:hypothetical protein